MITKRPFGALPDGTPVTEYTMKNASGASVSVIDYGGIVRSILVPDREGALADLIVVDLQKPHLQPVNDVVSNLVYCGKASDVDTVVVDGRIVVENRCVAGVDLPALYAGVAAAVARIKAGR